MIQLNSDFKQYLKREVANVVTSIRNNDKNAIQFSPNEIYKIYEGVVEHITFDRQDYFNFLNNARQTIYGVVLLINTKLVLHTLKIKTTKEKNSFVNNPENIKSIAQEMYLDLRFESLTTKNPVMYSEYDFRFITIENFISVLQYVTTVWKQWIVETKSSNKNLLTLASLVEYFVTQGRTINQTLRAGYQSQSMSLLRSYLELCATLITLFKSNDETITKYSEFSSYIDLILEHPSLSEKRKQILEDKLLQEMYIANAPTHDKRSFAYYGWMRYNKNIPKYGIKQLLNYSGLGLFEQFYAESSNFVHINIYSLTRDLEHLHTRTTYFAMGILEILGVEFNNYMNIKHPGFLTQMDFTYYDKCFDNLRDVILYENDNLNKKADN